jgi:prepilin-type N-terminal cleavage/methylation domain-containing protein
MRLSPVNKAASIPTANLGFTLLENLLVLLILSIAIAIGTPSILDMQQRQRLVMATDMVLIAMQEAQQTAIERSTVCSLKIDTTVMIDHNHCLRGGNLTLPSGVNMKSPGLDDSIEYGMKGNTVDNRTIRLSSQSSASGRCITVSAPLGITRQGQYSKVDQSCRSK